MFRSALLRPPTQSGGFFLVGAEFILTRMEPWNGWYHVSGNTYGTWLPGDPRGWREKKHRRHVEGDYKNPPPAGTGDELHRRSRGFLTHPPVRLAPKQREIVGQAMVEMLVQLEIELLRLSVSAVHFHLLGRFPDKKVRPRVGRAKKHACFVLRDAGHVGRLWTRKCHPLPIRGRAHQVNVFGYIGSHKERGAWVWTYREGLYWKESQDK